MHCDLELNITETTNLPIIIYYVPHLRCPVISDLEKLLNHRILLVTSWADLSLAVQNVNVKLLVIHASVIKENIGSGIRTFIKMVETFVQYETKTDIPFAVCVDKSYDYDFVRRIKETSISGIVPETIDYSLLDTAKSLQQLLSGNTYWPDDIIAALPKTNMLHPFRPLHIYFKPGPNIHITPSINKEIADATECRINYCTTWDELSLSLLSKPVSVMIHVSIFKWLNISIEKFFNLFNSLVYCIDSTLKINIGIAIEPDTDQSIINELLKHNILCIAPSYSGFGKDEYLTSVAALVKTGIYIPKHIISNLPNLSGSTNIVNKFCLTERQKEVLSLVCNRGLSNKKIAIALKISESTVKIHISAILKEYGVRNRTQLVLAASSALKA